jgi:hypothetical protein
LNFAIGVSYWAFVVFCLGGGDRENNFVGLTQLFVGARLLEFPLGFCMFLLVATGEMFV